MHVVVRQSKLARQRQLSAREAVTAGAIDTAALTRMYRQHLAECDDSYLRMHSGNAAVIARHVAAALLYEPYIGMRILDWGCKHGVDAFLVRAMRGDGVILDGCDFDPPERYASFHDAADMEYRQLRHPWLLPYSDATIDTVIASGVIEHVPQTSESLKELWRVIKTDGHLIVTFLPNRRSYTEWLSRRTGGLRHLKLFDINGFRDVLLHHGFEPILAGYHQVMPTLAGHSGNGIVQRLIGSAYRLNDVLERTPLVRSFAANIFIIAQRCTRLRLAFIWYSCILLNMIFREFTYKLQPTPDQELQFQQYAGVCLLVWNIALDQRMNWWRKMLQSTTIR